MSTKYNSTILLSTVLNGFFYCYRRNNDSRAVNRPDNRELKNRRDSDRNRDRNRDRDRDQDKRHERDEKRKDADRKPKSDQRKKQMKIKKVSSVTLGLKMFAQGGLFMK